MTLMITSTNNDPWSQLKAETAIQILQRRLGKVCFSFSRVHSKVCDKQQSASSASVRASLRYVYFPAARADT